MGRHIVYQMCHMKPKKTGQLHLRITEKLEADLTEICLKEDLQMGEVVRSFLRIAVRRHLGGDPGPLQDIIDTEQHLVG